MTNGNAQIVARPLLGKVILTGIIRAQTGLHIGASKEILEVGALDLPVLKNPVSREPYIPGSSLKGKLRSLCEQRMLAAATDPEGFFSRDVGGVKIHVCGETVQAAGCEVCRLFGSSGDRWHPGSNFPARLKVRDSYFTEYTRDDLEQVETGLLFTEIKFENALDRITAAANPRSLERVPAGSDFGFEMVYNVEQRDEVETDLTNLYSVLQLLEEDSLGGHGSRGSGKVAFAVTGLVGKKVEAYREASTAWVKQAIAHGTPGKKEEADILPTLSVVPGAIDELVRFFVSTEPSLSGGPV
jgi:CRISPR-associated protein Csm3